MKTIYTHRFTPVRRTARGGFTAPDETTKEAAMYDGQLTARDMARDNSCDVEHRTYNNYLHRWVYLGTYHADGTCTDSFGKRRRFTENPICPWVKID